MQNITIRQVIVLASVVALMLGTIPSLLAAMLITKAEGSFVTRQVAECTRNNQTRAVVADILTEIRGALADEYDSGLITKSDYKLALKRLDDRARLVSQVGCEEDTSEDGVKTNGS